jgi:hypothetical protein
MAGADGSPISSPTAGPFASRRLRMDRPEKSWGGLLDPADLGGCTILLSVSSSPSRPQNGELMLSTQGLRRLATIADLPLKTRTSQAKKLNELPRGL